MYDLKKCPSCNKKYLEDTTVIEYPSSRGGSYYDIQYGDWCLPNDMYSRIIQEIDHVFKDGMSLKELCMKLMDYFDLTKRTACSYTMWLISTMPVYLPDRKHIKLIPT